MSISQIITRSLYPRVIVALMFAPLPALAVKVIEIPPIDAGKDATVIIRKAIEEAGEYDGQEVVIRFSPSVYNISRALATPKLQHITNTTSSEENPDPTKHYGIYLFKKNNITLDGNGAVIMTHGEMTSIAIDSCSDVKIRNLTVKSADPSVIELRIVGSSDSTLVCQPIDPVAYRIDDDGKIFWQGEDWEFTGGIAQLYDGVHTWRCPSPTDTYQCALASGKEIVFKYLHGEVPL